MSAWTKSTLAQECSIAIGGTPARNSEDYWDLDKRTSNHWVAISDLHGRYITSTSERISDEGVRNSSAKLVERGSVLLSFKLTLGRTAIAGVDLYTNEAIAALRSDSLDHLFLHYGLQSWDLLGDVDQAIKGATLNKAKLKRIPISFPQDKKLQERIAVVLDAMDRAIEQTEALLAKQQRIKTGLMHDLLTRGLDAQGRLRDPSSHEFKPSTYGPIPKEWDVTAASALCDAVIDCKNRTPPSSPSGHPVIRTPNVRNGRFVYDDLAHTDKESYELWVSRGKPRVGDVVITREAPFGEACQIPNDIPAACLGQRMMMYQPNPDRLRGDYMVYAIYSRAVQSRILELAGGSTVGHIRVGDVRSLPIPHPRSTDEQSDICVALNSLSAIDAKSVAALAKLRRLKSGLMHDLLTGEVPVTPLLSNSAS